jgi:uncharacterized protein (DUF169 family)
MVEMSKLAEESRKLVEVLELEWVPIAGKFSEKAAEQGESSRKLRVCEALDVVRREKVTVNLSRVNCSCGGGQHFLGLNPMPLEKLADVLGSEHKAFQSVEVAMASVKKQPQPVKRGKVFVLGPLEKFDARPDLVIVFANPAQADRLLGLTSFKGAEPFMYYPASNICSTVTNVLAKGRPEINFVSVFERRVRGWSSNELIIAMPMKDFEIAVESIPQSGYGTNQT